MRGPFTVDWIRKQLKLGKRKLAEYTGGPISVALSIKCMVRSTRKVCGSGSAEQVARAEDVN